MRTSLKVLVSLLSALILGSCSSEDKPGGNTYLPEGNTCIEVKTDKNIRFTYDDMQACYGLERFSYKLMADAVANDDVMKLEGQNFAISPLSCVFDMAMLAQSTDSVSARKLCDILEVADIEKLGAACNKLMTYLPAPGMGIEFDVVNSVWYAERNASYISAEYIKTMNTTYFADVNAADLATDKGKEVINAWVNAKTHGLISDLDGLFQPSPSVDVLMLNALYFMGEWSKKFDPELTTDDLFHAPDGDKLVKMMHQRLFTRYCEDEKRVAFRLYFKDGGANVTFVLPKDGFTLADACLEVEEWNEMWRNSLNYRFDATISVPRFSVGSTVKMEGLPMLNAFSDISLSAMGLPNSRVGSIGQKTYINMDEEGAKVASVTVINGEVANGQQPEIKKVTVVLDRPFLFYVTNFKTGAIIMSGRVLDPTK